jgi:excisionase family DNA binding protein
MTKEELAAYLRVSPKTVAELIDRGVVGYCHM